MFFENIKISLRHINPIKEVLFKQSLTDKQWRGMACMLFLILFVIICFTFRDYGIIWDEIVQKNYGSSILLWYSSLFQDHSALSYKNLYMYGGFFETITQLASSVVVLLTSSSVFETRHLVNALFGLVGIVMTYKSGCLLSGRMGGFFSALFLAVTPRYYGHMFNNSKDIPFAVLFMIALYFIIRCYKHFPRLPKSVVVTTGIVIGLAMGVRVNGILLFFYLFLIAAGRLTAQSVLNPEKSFPLKESLMSIISVSVVFIIAWIVMIIWWPWAQVSPILHPVKAIFEFSDFGWGGMMFFKREFIRSENVPWNYILTWFSITLPEFYFIAIGAGILSCFMFLKRFRKTAAQFITLIRFGIFTAAFLLPIILVMITGSPLYDGLRHFLFVVPVLSVLCGTSIVLFIESINRNVLKRVLYGCVFASIGLTVYDMADLHPYQSVYFNRLIAGGLQKASMSFETDYAGNCYKEGSEWVFRKYRNDPREKILVAGATIPDDIIDYYLNYREYMAEERARVAEVFHMAEKGATQYMEDCENNNRKFCIVKNEKAEIYISSTRWNDHLAYDGDRIHVIERKKTPLCYIVKVKIWKQMKHD